MKTVEAQILKDGSKTQDRRCDLLFSPEPVEPHKLFTADRRKPKDNYWPCPIRLDQGREGMCVGYGITHALASSPISNKGLDASFAKEDIYWPAQRIDPWEGGSYPGADPFYEGTMVRAGLRIARKLGYITNYSICTSLDKMILGISHDGPCILGTKWFDSMYATDKHGFIAPRGKLVGGHCYIANGVNLNGELNYLNSWGDDYGNAGEMKMTFDSMQKLIGMGGEMYFVHGVAKENLNMLQRLLTFFMR